MNSENLKYIQAALWIICGCGVSNANDILMKMLGSDLGVVQTIFFRFFFNVILIFPFIFNSEKKILVTKNIYPHTQRVLIGVAAIGFACYSASILPLVDVTTLSFSQPIIFLPLAAIFLREKINFARTLATLTGFFGVLFVVAPKGITMQYLIVVPLMSSVLFSFLDIVTKKIIKMEHPLTLAFYFSLGCLIVTFPPLFYSWTTPSLKEIFLLFLLGVGGLMMQFCVYKSFYEVEVSSLAPFRYIELIFSCILGFLIFEEIPNVMTLFGSLVIFFSALYLTLEETKLFNLTLSHVFPKKIIDLHRLWKKS